MGLGQRLPIHLGDQVPRHLLAHVIGEVQLDHAARDLPLAEARQPCLPLHAREGALPCLLNDLGRLLDVEAPLACPHLLNVNLHRGSQIWCERGELNPHGFPLWILSPARLPIPPLSQSEYKTIRGRSSLFAEAVQMTSPCGEVRTRPLHRPPAEGLVAAQNSIGARPRAFGSANGIVGAIPFQTSRSAT